MISIKICNPETGLSFPEFIHNTTTYVAVPHGSVGELWVNANRTCTLVLEASGQEVAVVQVNSPGGKVNLSEICQPRTTERSVMDLIPSFGFGPFRHQKAPKIVQRLYAFRAYVVEGTKDQRRHGSMLASVDFHVLCDVDYCWAHSYHVQYLRNPSAQSISDQAEGNCPHCGEVRARLQKDWRFESV